MKEDSVQLVIRLLREAMGEEYSYFDGDPDLIAKHDLPAVLVEQVSDNTTGGTFAEDDVTDTLVVKVVFDKSDDWTNQDDKLKMTHIKLREAIAARVDDGNSYRPNTVKGALRPEVYGVRRIGGNLSVDFGILQRPNELITAEAHVTVLVMYSVDVSPEGDS